MRLKWLGPNVGYTTDYDPREIAAGGFNALAINVTVGVPLQRYLDAAHDAGLAVLGRIVGGSLDSFASPDDAARHYAAAYPNMDAWTILNEADGVAGENEDGSWILDPTRASEILAAFRDAMPNRPLYGVGTVRGEDSYFRRNPDLALWTYNGLDTHAYAQDGSSVWTMLNNYAGVDAAYGFRERLIAEFGQPGPNPVASARHVVELVRAIETGNEARARVGLSVVVGMFPYCWGREQHGTQFYLNDPEALDIIRSLGYGPAERTTPVPHVHIVGPGVRAEMAADATEPASCELYRPLSEERYRLNIPQDAPAEWSETMGKNGRLYRYVFDTQKVVRV